MTERTTPGPISSGAVLSAKEYGVDPVVLHGVGERYQLHLGVSGFGVVDTKTQADDGSELSWLAITRSRRHVGSATN